MGVVGLVVSLIMTFTIRYLACVMVWTLYIGAGMMVVIGTVLSWYKWHVKSTELEAIPEDDRLETDVEDVANWKWFSLAVTLFAVLFLLLLLFLRSRIALVVQLFREAANAVGKNPLILIQPVWTVAINLFVVIVIGYGVLYVFSAEVEPELNIETGFVKLKVTEHYYVSTVHYLFL